MTPIESFEFADSHRSRLQRLPALREAPRADDSLAAECSKRVAKRSIRPALLKRLGTTPLAVVGKQYDHVEDHALPRLKKA
ncbi:MAG: hypothetical protein KGL42_04800 [Betaproteobacteria bacterium]|nr:hypothetical protein [Betaproteobacteria bacterium]